ncbi:hypothetical protein [Chroococcidiopsis thermalis]|uniref:hypothetical protein n=1 Tax=Chroococcidiopsis thermalis TaxID=54299 RepID=UPI0002D2A73F|nr:hypothetical protein [Chroococcidiopsis thermalis]
MSPIFQFRRAVGSVNWGVGSRGQNSKFTHWDKGDKGATTNYPLPITTTHCSLLTFLGV